MATSTNYKIVPRNLTVGRKKLTLLSTISRYHCAMFKIVTQVEMISLQVSTFDRQGRMVAALSRAFGIYLQYTFKPDREEAIHVKKDVVTASNHQSRVSRNLMMCPT